MTQPPNEFVRQLKAQSVMVLTDVYNEIQCLLEPLGRPLHYRGRQWNPVRVDAWFWGTQNPRFAHGMAWSTFLQVMCFVLPFIHLGCEEVDYIPAGGGTNQVSGKTVVVRQLKKPKKKIKYVVNRNSPIRFDVPDITDWTKETIDKVFEEETKVRYATGYQGTGTAAGNLGEGEGDGAGFGAGNWKGMVRFIRIKYEGGDWNNNMGRGADHNMLIEFNLRSRGIKVAKQTEARTVDELNNFRMFNSPPFVYVTGHHRLNFSDREVRMLRSYMLEKHGMIFADAASPSWGRAFRQQMARLLPDVRPIYVPMDDEIHRRPFPIDRLPYVAPHDSPMMAIGWKVKGRWVAYYHPGDLADAWKDGHSGVKKDVAEAAYELGVNVIYYAYRQYSIWLSENKRKQ